MRTISVCALAVALTGCGPSCSERGGRLVFTYFLSVFTGKTTTLVPQYKCEGATEIE